MPQSRTPFLGAGLAAMAALLFWSGWQPYDRFTWVLEIAPILIVVPVLLATYRRFPLTSLLYFLIFLARWRVDAGWRVHLRSCAAGL